jgi:hypothetical protein
MPASYDCPACGAPLDPSVVSGAHVTCGFCHRAVVVPQWAGSVPDSALSAEQSVGLESELRELLGKNRKIEAVKRYRETFGTSLVIAKDAVEALEAGERLRRPTAKSEATVGGGASRQGVSCIVALALIVVGAVGFAFVAAG